MFTAQFLLAAVMAVLATAAPALPALDAIDPVYAQQLKAFYARNPSTTVLHSNGKRQSYQWVCNDKSFTYASLRVCQNYLQLTEKGQTCTADPGNAETGRLCANTNLRVTGLAWNGKKTSVMCEYAGDAVNFLTLNCGQKGGSAVANHNGNFIVHVNDHWIN